MNRLMKLFVHSGVFHLDDVLCAVIFLLYFKDELTQVDRVREIPKDMDPLDFAADVGGIYDPDKNLFDHHQKGGADDGHAACGKMWKKFGKQLCCGDQQIADRVALTFLDSVNRADIGVADWAPVREDWRHLSAGALIHSMNPAFGSDEEEYTKRFRLAVEAMEIALEGSITTAQAFILGQIIVKHADEATPKVLVLSKPIPWQEHVHARQDLNHVLYVIYPSERGGYCLQAVPDKPGSFGMKKPLPKAWSGLRDSSLASVTGVEDAMFCHVGLFIGGAKSLEGTIRLAKMAVEA